MCVADARLDFSAGLGHTKKLAADKISHLVKYFDEIFNKILHEVSVRVADSRLDFSAGLGQKNLAAKKNEPLGKK